MTTAVGTAAPFQVCPPLTDDERDALEASIKEHGVLVPVVLTQDGRIVDGHHRAAIAESLGVGCPTETLPEATDDEYVALAISLNADRRQLTREQRRELVARAIKAQPEASDRKIASETGVSHPTVGAIRGELEASGDVESLSTRTDTLGRSQPATKPTTPAGHECTECGERFDYAVWHCAGCAQHWNAARVKVCPDCNPTAVSVDTATGEVLDEHGPTTRGSDPISEAVEAAKSTPMIVGAKAMERLVIVNKTIAAAGGVDAILSDLHGPDADDLAGLWVGFIDDAIASLEALRAGLRRRNLRSVK